MSLSTASARYSAQDTPVGLVFDAGTGGVRGAGYDARTGEWLGEPAESAYSPTYTEDDPPHVILEPDAGTKAMRNVIEQLLGDGRLRTHKTSLRSIYVAGHMHAPFCVGKSGKTVKFPVHMWNSAAAQADAQLLREKLGWTVPDRVTVSHIARFARLNPDRFESEVSVVTTQSGFLAAQLSGGKLWGLDPCEFSGLGVNDPVTGQVSKTLLQLFSFSLWEKLPRRLWPNEILGRATKDGCELFSIPPEWGDGAVIAAPGGDQGCGRDGLGLRPEHAGLVLGSSVVLTTETLSRPEGHQFDPFMSPNSLFLNMGLFANGMRTGDEYLSEAARVFGESTDAALRRLSELATSAAPDCGGAFAVNFKVADPGLGVSRALTVSPPIEATPGERWRLIWMQIGASIAMRLKGLVGAGSPPKMLVVGGAAARDDGLLQVIADIVQIPLLQPEGAARAMLEGGKARGRLAEELANGKKVDPIEFMHAECAPPKGKTFSPRAELAWAYAGYLQRFADAIRQAS